jgi:aromatic ring-opening dioxygenase LigB subunit
VLVAAAVCPHPPMLVPEVAGGAAAELTELRSACQAAVSDLMTSGADELVIVGGDPDSGTYPGSAGASLHPYGLDLRVGGPDGQLPLALAIAAWLVGQIGPPVSRRYVGVAPDASTQECLELGRALIDNDARTALLVMGDGSARLTRSSPGPYDERAAGFDRLVAQALGSGDIGALAALDSAHASELMAAGRAAWQVMAGTAGAVAEPSRVEARLRLYVAPYGVGYFVASWQSERLERVRA